MGGASCVNAAEMALRMMLCGRALGRRLVPPTARCMRTYSSQNRKSIECAKMRCT